MRLGGRFVRHAIFKVVCPYGPNATLRYYKDGTFSIAVDGGPWGRPLQWDLNLTSNEHAKLYRLMGKRYK